MQAGLVDVSENAAVSRALMKLRARSDMDLAFGARVNPDGRAMRIANVNGGLTNSLSGLAIASGAGLGGKSLVIRRPTQVRDYLVAQGITHDYDHAVEQERMRTVVALPLWVGARARYVVYLGSRSALELGDRWLDALSPLVNEFTREMAVLDEVRGRLCQFVTPSPGGQPGLSDAELREIGNELASLAEQVVDEDIKLRLRALHARVTSDHTVVQQLQPPVSLTPREIAVLKQVAQGRSNAAAAEVLGLLPNTVKSYLKSAMRKLDAANRVQAIVTARKAGVID